MNKLFLVHTGMQSNAYTTFQTSAQPHPNMSAHMATVWHPRAHARTNTTYWNLPVYSWHAMLFLKPQVGWYLQAAKACAWSSIQHTATQRNTTHCTTTYTYVSADLINRPSELASTSGPRSLALVRSRFTTRQPDQNVGHTHRACPSGPDAAQGSLSAFPTRHNF